MPHNVRTFACWGARCAHTQHLRVRLHERAFDGAVEIEIDVKQDGLTSCTEACGNGVVEPGEPLLKAETSTQQAAPFLRTA